MPADTASTLYWLAIIAVCIVGPIAFILWRRVQLQLAYAGQGDGDEGAELDERGPPAHAAQQTAAGTGGRPSIQLAPLEAVVTQLLQTTPHIGIIGDSGAGKTTTGEAMLRILIGEAYVIDPKWWQGKWGGLAAAAIAGTEETVSYAPIERGLAAVFKEFNRRRLYKQSNPEARFQDLWLVWDEINDTMEELPEAGVPLRRLLRIGREYGIHVLFFPQSDRVKALGLEGHGDAVKNVLWVYLGNDAREIVKRLARDKRIDAATEQYITTLERPGVVGHGGQFYAVDLSNAMALAAQPVRRLTSWEVPVPSSEGPEISDFTLGTPELPVREPSKKLPDIREAAIRYWISLGEKDTPIALKLDMRKGDALELVKGVRARMAAEANEKSLHQLQRQLIQEEPMAA